MVLEPNTSSPFFALCPEDVPFSGDEASMARTPGPEFHEQLYDLTECSICAEIFTNPKTLPCVHTFCLHCLEKYGKDKNPGDQIACPLCRNESVIPKEGFAQLPNNFFINKIVEIGKLATVTAKETVCELCIEETAIAKKFCVDCQQKLCDRCSNSHPRIKHCQNHQVVELGSQLYAQDLKFPDSYCEHHPKELIKMYCYKENVAICLICFAESHQSHKCANIDKAAGEFAEQLKVNMGHVANRRPECDEAFQKLEKFKKEFIKEIADTEESIRKSGAELKELIDRHVEELVQNLKVIKDGNFKSFETAKQEVSRFRVMIDSYQKYCEGLVARGSPVDICRAASQMQTRANDLEQHLENCSVDDFTCVKITFQPAKLDMRMKQYGTNNIVGELKVSNIKERIVNFQSRVSEINFPANWEPIKSDEDFKRIQLKTGDQEYKDVAKAVFSTAQTTVNQIFKIERIQNKLLYKQYAVRKAAMDATNPGIQNEMTLWHGTSATTLESINKTGFNQSYCGRNAIAYGRGVYFAKNFSFSAQRAYSPPDANGYKHIYQCKVLTGKYVVGDHSMREPPSESGNTYDSTVDNDVKPTIFVIYNDTQAYPEYLIYFK